MISTHVYAAVLIGDPDLDLSVTGGRVSLDAGRAPHVTGDIDVAIPSFGAAVLGLDPRLNPRVRITVGATFPATTQEREFDLGVRDRTILHEDATMSVSLASDESLLNDFAPLADDVTALEHQNSLRDIIDYVLNTAIPGAALEAGDDAPMYALAQVENLIRNPRAAVNMTDWAATWVTGGLTPTRYATGGPTEAPSYYDVQATGGATTGAYVYYDNDVVSIAAGRTYLISVWVRAYGSQQVALDAWLLDATPTIVAVAPSVVETPAGSWVQLSTIVTATPTATKMRPRVEIVGTMASTDFVGVTGWRLSEYTGDPTDVGYFDGDTTDTASYGYSFGSASHASPSRRVPLIEAPSPESLIWKAGTPAYEFLNPLVQAAGLRLVCDESRAWTLRDEEYRASGALSIRHGVNITSGEDTISRDSGLWFDACVIRYRWTDLNGNRQERVDSFAQSDPYTQLKTFNIDDQPYPGPGRAEYAVRRAQGRGREIVASAVSDWRARAEMPMTVVLDGSPILTGIAQSIVYDFGNDEVTVTMRAVETPPLAWVLGPDDLTWDDAASVTWEDLTDWSDL